jgi:hypothetical protein
MNGLLFEAVDVFPALEIEELAQLPVTLYPGGNHF